MTIITKTRELENELYDKSILYLESIEKGQNYINFFEVTLERLIVIIHPNRNTHINGEILKKIGVRLFNSALIAYRNALSGYYQASFYDQRDMIEIQFLLDYFKSYPEKIEEWRDATNKERIEKFAPGFLYKLLDKRDGWTHNKRRDRYKMYCEYAAHVSYPGMKLLTNDNNEIEIGSFYNEKKLINTIHALCENFSLVVAMLGAQLKADNLEANELLIKHMEAHDKVFDTNMASGKDFEGLKADIKALKIAK